MRVAFVIPRLEPARGGVERYAFGLASGLARRGVELCAFTTTPPERLPPRLPGFEIERIEVGAGTRAGRERRFGAAVRQRLAARPGWNAIQEFGDAGLATHHRIGGGSHAAWLRARARYEPGAWPARIRSRDRRRIARQREIWRDPRVALVANSRLGRDHAAADAGIDPERIRVIHNGVDLEAFRPEPDRERAARLRDGLGLGREALAVAFVGSGFARKGLRFAIAMLARARARGARVELLVAGRGRLGPYRRLARRLGVAGAVRFAGPVADVARIYAASDAFLLPSLYEPFSNAALEALACGLPVLATAESGIAEVVEDGREGFLLPRPDAVERGGWLLERLAREPELRRAMGERAREGARRLDQERHVERMLALYRAPDV